MTTKIYGVALNDADYIVTPTINNVQVECPFYRRWRSMITRCYSAKYQKRQPAYKGCTVCDEWLTFSNFKSWMETQDWEGKCLDKDLLVYQNKVYSPETCVFVSQELNKFLLKRDATRGKYPLGVSYCETRTSAGNMLTKPYRSEIRAVSKLINLGYYKTPEEAHRAWQKAKAAQAFDLALEQTDERVKQGLLRVYEKILSDYENNLETIDF